MATPGCVTLECREEKQQYIQHRSTLEERHQQQKKKEAHESTKEREKAGDKVGSEGGVDDLL